MDKIFIVGFSGAGKSTVGKRLASRLGWQFYDTDAFIESKYHLSIPDFFEKYGENAFRICEKAALKELLHEQQAVIATGGGTPCFFDNMDEMLQHGFVVYLKLSAPSLFTRLQQSHKARPLTIGKNDAQLLEYIETTLQFRETYYNKAHLTMKGENLSLPSLLEIVKEKVLEK